MNENEKHLLKIKDEMENVRELYIKGYIEKKIYQKETRTLFEVAVKYPIAVLLLAVVLAANASRPKATLFPPSVFDPKA